MTIEIKELMGWLISPYIPIGSTLSISDIYNFYFYKVIKDNCKRNQVVNCTIEQLKNQGYIDVDKETVIKKHFIDIK